MPDLGFSAARDCGLPETTFSATSFASAARSYSRWYSGSVISRSWTSAAVVSSDSFSSVVL